jgi:predicted nucleic acid-binding protein
MRAIRSIEGGRFIDVTNEIATIAGEIRFEQKKDENRVVKAPDSIIIACAVSKKYDLFTLDKGMWFADRYGLKIIKE